MSRGITEWIANFPESSLAPTGIAWFPTIGVSPKICWQFSTIEIKFRNHCSRLPYLVGLRVLHWQSLCPQLLQRTAMLGWLLLVCTGMRSLGAAKNIPALVVRLCLRGTDGWNEVL